MSAMSVPKILKSDKVISVRMSPIMKNLGSRKIISSFLCSEWVREHIKWSLGWVSGQCDYVSVTGIRPDREWETSLSISNQRW